MNDNYLNQAPTDLQTYAQRTGYVKPDSVPNSPSQRNRNDLLWYHQIQKVYSPPASTYTVTPQDDILLCQVSTTITLPVAARGREIQIIKDFAGGFVKVYPSGNDTIMGTTSMTILVDKTCMHMKAIGNKWLAI